MKLLHALSSAVRYPKTAWDASVVLRCSVNGVMQENKNAALRERASQHNNHDEDLLRQARLELKEMEVRCMRSSTNMLLHDHNDRI